VTLRASQSLIGADMTRLQRDEKGRFLPKNQVAHKHGCIKYLSSGRLPERKSIALRKELKRIREELEKLIPERTVKEELLINQVLKTFGFCSIFETYLKEYGIMDKTELKAKKLSFQKGFDMYLKMLSRQALTLQSLGVSKKESEELLTPLQIVAQDEEEQEQRQ